MAWFKRFMEDALTNQVRGNGRVPVGTRTNGMVWDGSRFIQEGNVGDPEQVLKNRPEQSALAGRYLDWNSSYNTDMRKWLQRMYSQSTGGADSLFASGIDPTSGVGAANREVARSRAGDAAARTAWEQFQASQGLGVQAQLAYDKDTLALREMLNQRQMFNDQRRDQVTGDIIGGIADIGLTAITGGFAGPALAAGGLSSETENMIDGMVDAGGRYTGTLESPNYVPGRTFRRDATPDFTGALNATQRNPSQKKSLTWGSALNYPNFMQYGSMPPEADYGADLLQWRGPYPNVRQTQPRNDLMQAWWNTNNWWKGY